MTGIITKEKLVLHFHCGCFFLIFQKSLLLKDSKRIHNDNDNKNNNYNNKTSNDDNKFNNSNE